MTLSFINVIILITFRIKFGNLSENVNECELWKRRHIYDENNYTLVHNFNSFKDLENDCNQTHASNCTLIEFSPKTPDTLILNKEFRLNHLVESLANQSNLEACILLGFRGVEIYFGKIGRISFLKSDQYLVAPSLLLAFTQLEFYLENQLLSANECDIAFLNHTNDFLFSKFIQIEFVNVKYPRFICPFVFRNFFLRVLSFGSISNSLLNRNRLNFLDIKKSHDTPYSIVACTFSLIYDVFDTRVMNRYLFEKLQILVISGIVDALEEDIFKCFTNLTKLIFIIDNF